MTKLKGAQSFTVRQKRNRTESKHQKKVRIWSIILCFACLEGHLQEHNLLKEDELVSSIHCRQFDQLEWGPKSLLPGTHENEIKVRVWQVAYMTVLLVMQEIDGEEASYEECFTRLYCDLFSKEHTHLSLISKFCIFERYIQFSVKGKKELMAKFVGCVPCYGIL